MRPVLLCLLLIAPLCIAAPLRLSLQSEAEQLQFHYRFDDSERSEELMFSIDNSSLNNHFRQFRALKPALMQQYLWRDLREHVAKYPGVRLRRLAGKNALRYELESRDNSTLLKLDTELAQLLVERRAYYLHQYYYTELTLPWGTKVIIPDHQRLMQDSLTDLLPVATAWHKKLVNITTRQSLAMLTNWVQQIPYQDLTDRNNSAGASFSPPLRLLQENRGDCDSKAVLLAAVLRMLLPDVKLAIIYLPKHAMLAIQLPTAAEDMTVTIENKPYLLVDATGPASLAPGQISTQYRMYTESGQFGYQLL